MSSVTSKDGTTIAYEKTGEGPAVILIDGALGYREYWGGRSLAAELAEDFAVFVYDRRGRGESTDRKPYAVAREIEDIAALVDEAGGAVCLYGNSSGAVLALRAAAQLGDNVAKLALSQPPFETGETAKHDFDTYVMQMTELLEAGKHGDAVAFFLGDMVPPDMLDALRQAPEWPLLEAVAPTLAYDNAVLGDGALPAKAARVATMPTLVLDGSASPGFMQEAADALAKAMPNAQRKTIDGQVLPEALAPVLREFVTSGTAQGEAKSSPGDPIARLKRDTSRHGASAGDGSLAKSSIHAGQ